MIWSLLCADVLEGLAALPDASFDACLCDPPYGLSETPDTAKVLRHWLENLDYDHRSKGFMNAAWDSFVPGPRVWQEVLRVLKPGGHLFAFGGTRMYDLLAVAVRLAGFEIRDSFLVPGAAWLYGAGFPKSLDIGKAIDKAAGAERADLGPSLNWREAKRDNGQSMNAMPNESRITAPATPEAARWNGYGTAVKPAWEFVLVAAKPLDGTFAQNALRHGVAGINVDGGRIGTTKRVPASISRKLPANCYGKYAEGGETVGVGGHNPSLGRWPANLAFVHHPDCREAGTVDVASNSHHPAHRGRGGLGTAGHSGQTDLEERRDGRETVAAWECVEECPVRQLDLQAGERSSGLMRAGTRRSQGGGYRGGFPGEATATDTPGDTGSASRFFYAAKVSRGERERGLLGRVPCVGCRRLDSTHHVDAEGREVSCQRNVHPTLKPIDLCRYFATLLLPPKRLPGEPPRRLIVPFSGSGSEIIGALLAGWDQVVGIEQSLEDCNVARHRIGSADPEHVAAQPVRMPEITGPLFEVRE